VCIINHHHDCWCLAHFLLVDLALLGLLVDVAGRLVLTIYSTSLYISHHVLITTYRLLVKLSSKYNIYHYYSAGRSRSSY
jgi:hypothetical protein